MLLTGDELGDLDAAQRRNLGQGRAEVDRALEGGVVRRVRVELDLRRLVEVVGAGRVERGDERALRVRVGRRRRGNGGEEERVDLLGLARLLLLAPVDLVEALVRLEADREGACRRAAQVRRREEGDRADAELAVRVCRQAEWEGEGAAARGEGEKVRGAGRERDEPVEGGRGQL